MKPLLRKLILGTGATIILAGNFVSPVGTVLANSTSQSPISIEKEYEITDPYEVEHSEEVIIEGTTYVYDYKYEDNQRIMYITNQDDKTVEKIHYNINDSTIYHNDEILGVLTETSNTENSFTPASIWTTIGNESYYISWAQGTSVTVVAGALSAYLGTLGTAGVIAAMGTGALAALAAAVSGGTLNLVTQRYITIFGGPQHRFIWSFTANTGDKYGDYIYHI